MRSERKMLDEIQRRKETRRKRERQAKSVNG